MPTRTLRRAYHLDANRINARQRDPFVNQLERWQEEKIIFLEMALPAYEEAGYGNVKRMEKADEYTWVSTNDSLDGEAEFRQAIERIVFPGGAKNQTK